MQLFQRMAKGAELGFKGVACAYPLYIMVIMGLQKQSLNKHPELMFPIVVGGAGLLIAGTVVGGAVGAVVGAAEDIRDAFQLRA